MKKITMEMINNAGSATEALGLCLEQLEEHTTALAVVLGLAGIDHTARMIAEQVKTYPDEGARGIATIAMLRLAQLRLEGKA
jgi:hypothetical protein